MSSNHLLKIDYYVSNKLWPKANPIKTSRNCPEGNKRTWSVAVRPEEKKMKLRFPDLSGWRMYKKKPIWSLDHQVDDLRKKMEEVQWSEKENGGREAGSRWKDQFVTDIWNWLLRHWVPLWKFLVVFPSVSILLSTNKISLMSHHLHLVRGITAAFHVPTAGKPHNTVSISERLVGAGSICGWI